MEFHILYASTPVNLSTLFSPETLRCCAPHRPGSQFSCLKQLDPIVWVIASVIILAMAVAELWADGLQRASKSPSQPMDITEAKQSFSKVTASS